MKLHGKVALVTGGGCRVGQALSLGLADAGVVVAIHYHQSETSAKATQAQIRAQGGKATLFQADLSCTTTIRKVVEDCVQHFGRIDVLVNNAAIYKRTPLLETTDQDWETLFAMNLKAPFFCSKEVAAHMLKQRSGKIINIADVSALSPWPDFIPYCTTKAGLIAVTKGLAKTLAPHIQVNAIASGTVLLGENADTEHQRKIEENTLLKRIGSPTDIVNTVLYLIEGSDYITGEVITVDGGARLA